MKVKIAQGARARAGWALFLAGMGSASGEVDFRKEVWPIIRANCLQCHGAQQAKGGLRMHTRAALLAGGETGPAVVVGNAAESEMIFEVEEGEMPPEEHGEPLDAPEIEILRAWIDQGLHWEKGVVVNTPDLAVSIAPGGGFWVVQGNKAMFRQHHGQDAGWGGGLEAAFEHWLDADTNVTGEVGVGSPHSYDVRFAVLRPETGFLRGGFEQFRSYYNDTGGYYAPFAESVASSFSLGRDLHVDTGRIWAEVGLTRPDLPELVVGYEFRYREGVKSTLHWGPSTQLGGLETRNMFPASKRIEENLHLLRADLRHEFAGIEMENRFAFEWSRRATSRREGSPLGFEAVPDSYVTVDESHDATRFSNMASVQKQVRDWWFLSGGYYFARMDADAAFEQHTVSPAGANVIGEHWLARPIVTDWTSHVLNANTRLGPWEGFTVSGGLQGTWLRQSAVGTSTLFFGLPDPGVPAPAFFTSRVGSNRQSFQAEQTVALRYTGLPSTVLFAEGGWKQENGEHFEQEAGMLQGFQRDTGTTSRDQDYRVGFHVSPRTSWSLSARYRYGHEKDHYDHLRDTSLGNPDAGYSAFIRGREVETHQVKARLNMRPRPWLRTLLTYRVQSSDYRTDTDPVTFGLPSDSPGGKYLAGEYSASIYGCNVVLIPRAGLTLNGTFTFHDSRTETASNGDPAVRDFEGKVYSLQVGGSYALNERTDLVADYAFTQGDFSQGRNTQGFPLGIEYQQQTAQAGVAWQVSENVRARLHYQFQDYEEASTGGINDYSAHGVFLNCSVSWN